jgi:hypothetical protein
LREVIGNMGAHDALELLAWAPKDAIANHLWDVYYEIGQLAVPSMRQGVTALEGSCMSRYRGRVLQRKGGARGPIRTDLPKDLSCR